MHKKHFDRSTILLSVLLILTLIATGYFGYQTLTLTEALARYTADSTNALSQKEQELAQVKEQNQALTDVLAKVEEELDELEDDYRKEKDKNDEFDDQIRKISKTVGTLDKLSKTDEELLQKYSKVYFLNENYIPSDLDQIASDYMLPEKDTAFFHGDAISFLEDMIDDAADDDIDLKVVSAYRSFDTQEALKGQYTQTYGSGANTFSADQGYSEHQLGTTVDLTDPATAGTYTSFAETEAYQWLLRNAHKYGFTLSYPEDNGFYIFEPWHWRFVGVELAEDLRDSKSHFYDWDQRKIDSYLVKIFD